MLTSTTGRRRRLFVFPAALLAVMALAAAACGGDGGEGGPPGGETPAGGPATFDISMGDNFFDPAEFTVDAGQEVAFNITNGGVAIHNMRVAGEDGEYNTDDDAVSEPAQFNAGDTGSLEWTAAEEAGTIDFRCDFHPDVSIGTITVQ